MTAPPEPPDVAGDPDVAEDGDESSPGTPTTPKRWQWTTKATIVTLLSFMVVYAASLTSYYWLIGHERKLPTVDTHAVTEETVVVVTLQSINTREHYLNAKVLVRPGRALIDPQLEVLTQDISVWLEPSTDLGELTYLRGDFPTEVTATLPVDGKTHTWPFDDYSVGPLTANLLVGTGDRTQKQPVRIEVTGHIEDWDIDGVRSGPNGFDETIKFSRTRGQLFFDLGIFAILLALPALCMYVAVQTARGRKKFLPPMTTWFAAVLFAILPLRNILPGAPPPGVWIDQAIVLWVLISLVTAMMIYFIGWHRDAE